MIHHFVLYFDEDYITSAAGTGPVDAIVGHYRDMDMYCSAPDDTPDEDLSLTVCEIREEDVETVERLIADLEDEERAAAIEAYLGKRWTVTGTLSGGDLINAMAIPLDR